ncbi:hypothetical protein BH09BAC3_BH09BAC3_11830 [soil metagenome]
MQNLISGPIGLTHVISAIMAMSLGAIVLFKKRGTLAHKRLGYAYFASMLVLNITAFLIYRLFGRFGPFHWAALLSLTTLMMGFIPAILKKPKVNWIYYHMAGMYYSVVGLYSAFVSEVVTRIPGVPFFTIVAVATFIIFFGAVWWFQKYKEQWLRDAYPDQSKKM